MTEKILKSDNEWIAQLTPEQYHICRNGGTERAFTGDYNHFTEDGEYLCVCCGSLLFSSKSKYDSGSGWPSFSAPTSKKAIETREDNSLAMQRTEVCCARCDAHLGHVFHDGPDPTGLRYCMNSVSLRFISSKEN